MDTDVVKILWNKMKKQKNKNSSVGVKIKKRKRCDKIIKSHRINDGFVVSEIIYLIKNGNYSAGVSKLFDWQLSSTGCSRYQSVRTVWQYLHTAASFFINSLQAGQ